MKRIALAVLDITPKIEVRFIPNGKKPNGETFWKKLSVKTYPTNYGYLSFKEMGKITGLNPGTIYDRLSRGESPERILLSPEEFSVGACKGHKQDKGKDPVQSIPNKPPRRKLGEIRIGTWELEQLKLQEAKDNEKRKSRKTSLVNRRQQATPTR